MSDKAMFADVVFELDPMLSLTKRLKLERSLLENGAVDIATKRETQPDARATHYITHSPSQKHEAEHQVIPKWVEAAVRNGFLHDPEYYNPNPKRFLSGVVVAGSGLPNRDLESIFGACLCLGGQYRYDTELARDVTHLVCIAPHGAKYEEAMRRSSAGEDIKVVMPHWFDECFKLRRYVREDIYQFPDPPFARSDNDDAPMAAAKPESPNGVKEAQTAEGTPSPALEGAEHTAGDGDAQLSSQMSSSQSKPPAADLPPALETPEVHLAPSLEQLRAIPIDSPFLSGKRVYFHSDLGVAKDRMDLLRTKLDMAGATITTDPQDAHITLFKFRRGPEYQHANKNGKIVGSLNYLTNTLYRQRLISPLSTVWDFPVPRGSIPGMEKKVATITGYEGETRGLLFLLCAMVGLRYNTSLDNDTTLLICAKRNTTKFNVATLRNLDVVNHLWLEECFQMWECKSLANERYTYFPKNDILQSLVGKTTLVGEELARWNDDHLMPPHGPYLPAHVLCSKSRGAAAAIQAAAASKSSAPQGALVPRAPRKAAIHAQDNLQQILVPDMNRYDHEVQTQGKRRRPLSDNGDGNDDEDDEDDEQEEPQENEEVEENEDNAPLDASPKPARLRAPGIKRQRVALDAPNTTITPKTAKTRTASTTPAKTTDSDANLPARLRRKPENEEAPVTLAPRRSGRASRSTSSQQTQSQAMDEDSSQIPVSSTQPKRVGRPRKGEIRMVDMGSQTGVPQKGPLRMRGIKIMEMGQKDQTSSQAAPQAASSRARRVSQNSQSKVKDTSKDDEEYDDDPMKEDEENSDNDMPPASRSPNNWRSRVPTRIITSGVELTPAQIAFFQSRSIEITDNVHEASHIIIPDKFLRTPKVVCAINLGVVVITMDWVRKCVSRKRLNKAGDYLIKDAAAERKFRFDMETSLDRSNGNAHGWLHGYYVCILHTGKSKALRQVLDTTGATLVKALPTSKSRIPGSSPDTFLALCDRDDPKLASYKAAAKNLGIQHVYDVELLLVGSLRQELNRKEFAL
ncbi:hypothetical protein BC940DRAFT_345099 [Gongronella butleri]|nr:hypothetical protein BC940DRAFT_345099 [Gongronella butleri]